MRALKQENAKLADDSRGAANLLRAKDKQLDSLAAQVEEARQILIQNGARFHTLSTPTFLAQPICLHRHL